MILGKSMAEQGQKGMIIIQMLPRAKRDGKLWRDMIAHVLKGYGT